MHPEHAIASMHAWIDSAWHVHDTIPRRQPQGSRWSRWADRNTSRHRLTTRDIPPWRLSSPILYTADDLHQHDNTPPPTRPHRWILASSDRLICKTLHRLHRLRPLRRQRPRHRRRHRSRHLRRQRLHQLGIIIVMTASRRRRTNRSGGLIANDVLWHMQDVSNGILWHLQGARC
jgi:hypothetical protein